MGPKINVRARIERHSRVLQHHLYAGTKKTGKTGIALISAIAVLLFPIYPSFASFVGNNSVTEFYRGDIDESSIIDSYFGENDTVGDGDVFIQSKDSYLYVNASYEEGARDVTTSNEIVEYEVQSGDSVALIAQRFGVTRNSIYWANNFSDNHVLHPGEVIKVPPVSGLIHEVKSGETLSGLAQKYNVSTEDIMRQNLLLSGADLKAGDTIVIPGAIKETPKPVVPKVPQAVAKAPVKTSGKTGTATTAKSGTKTESVSSNPGSYGLKWRKPQHTFYWGNCTWYVAQYKNVNWGGNANQWLANAKAAGHKTGSTASAGAIVQFTGRGYNPRYGHVGIVTEVTDTHIIVSDMNYRALGEVTTRKVALGDRTIDGYIYVD